MRDSPERIALTCSGMLAGLADGQTTRADQGRRDPFRECLFRLSPGPTHLPRRFVHDPGREKSRHCRSVGLRQVDRLPVVVPVL